MALGGSLGAEDASIALARRFDGTIENAPKRIFGSVLSVRSQRVGH
jgi:hypothetical protein